MLRCCPLVKVGGEDVVLDVRTLEAELTHILLALLELISLKLTACCGNYLTIHLNLCLQE